MAIAADNSSDLFIGCNSFLDNRFRGGLDEVRIYNHAISIDMILQLHYQGFSKLINPQTAAQPHWHLYR